MYDEIEQQLLRQERGFFYKLLPEGLYRWIRGDQYLDIDAIRGERSTVASRIGRTACDVWVTYHVARTRVELLRDGRIAFPRELADTVSELEQQRETLDSVLNEVPIDRVRAVEYARLYRQHRELEALIDRIETGIRDWREDTVEQFDRVLGETDPGHVPPDE